jgi:hypothetical protein
MALVPFPVRTLVYTGFFVAGFLIPAFLLRAR